jgi:hypothetical protein
MTVLDIGAASGFFSFEMERRGGLVIATDLPSMPDHDFGPVYWATADVPGNDSCIRQSELPPFFYPSYPIIYAASHNSPCVSAFSLVY